jgi:F-type H+-transporting ATPase subunit epsilon
VSLRIVVLTPQATVVSEEVDTVVVPLIDGWRGIMPGHAPFASRLMPGEVILRVEGKDRAVATIGGLLHVDHNTATILTGIARLGCNLETLEREISDEARQLAAIETEAEKHFDRVLRKASTTFTRRRRRDS